MKNQLVLLPQKKKSTTKQKRCDHDWRYDHSIYSLGENREGVAIHRQCGVCGIHEICKIVNPAWSRSVRGFDLPDLR